MPPSNEEPPFSVRPEDVRMRESRHYYGGTPLAPTRRKQWLTLSALHLAFALVLAAFLAHTIARLEAVERRVEAVEAQP